MKNIEKKHEAAKEAAVEKFGEMMRAVERLEMEMDAYKKERTYRNQARVLDCIQRAADAKETYEKAQAKSEVLKARILASL